MKRTTVAAALAGTGVALVLAQPASAAETAPVYRVTQEGMTAEESSRLAEAYRIPDALHENGAFGYVGDDFGQVPLRHVASGKDESGRPTSSQGLDRRALAQLKPIGAEEALDRASWLTELIGLTDLELNPKVSHAKLTLSDTAGRPTSEHLLDTTVSHSFKLAGLPVTGQGAKLRITFGPDGNVTQLSSAMRKLEKAGEEPIIPSDEARKACERLYDRGVRQGEPTLGYLLPALGAVEAIYPSYTCNPSSEKGEQAHLQVPAVEGIGPKATIEVTRKGEQILGRVVEAAGDGSVYKWSSSSTVLSENEGEEIAYERRPRGKTTDAETLSLEVTDRNGLSATASITLAHEGFEVVATHPGGGGFGKLAVGPTDVGIEQTVDEWQCAQDSAIGFKSVMASKGVPTVFDWRGWSAWERDFKDTDQGRHRPRLRRQRRRPVVHRPRLVRRLHVQERDRRHGDHPRRRPLGRPRPGVDAARVLPGAARHQRLPRLLLPLGRSGRRPAHAQRLPHQRVLRRRRHRRHVRGLPVPAPDPVLDAAGPHGPQRLGADGDRQGAERRGLPLDGQHRPGLGHQHR